MSKLLYIPNGKICTWHKESSADRTVIIEESDIFIKDRRDINHILKLIIEYTRCNFREVNEINPSAIIEEFEVIND